MAPPVADDFVIRSKDKSRSLVPGHRGPTVRSIFDVATSDRLAVGSEKRSSHPVVDGRGRKSPHRFTRSGYASKYNTDLKLE
jgi:hypothetical protein